MTGLRSKRNKESFCRKLLIVVVSDLEKFYHNRMKES